MVCPITYGDHNKDFLKIVKVRVSTEKRYFNGAPA